MIRELRDIAAGALTIVTLWAVLLILGAGVGFFVLGIKLVAGLVV